MKPLLIALLFAPFVTLAQSPFDGTWVINSETVKLPDKPQVFVLDKGMFCCVLTQRSIKADGHDYRLQASDVDTVSIKVINRYAVEVAAKKSGRAMFTTSYTVSQDGSLLAEVFRDTTETEAVTTETWYQRIEKGPVGAHAISGSWRAYKTRKSRNGSIIKYKCTAEGFTAETPLGERYYGKFDGQFYPTEDDPYRTLASVRLLDSRTVELTQKREGKIIGVLRLTVGPDGRSIHGVYQSKLDNTSSSFEMEKQM